MEKRYADQGGMSAVVIKLRLPDGTMYNQAGKIDYIEPTVQATTDTILLRGKIANPPRKPIVAGQAGRPAADRRRVRHRAGRGHPTGHGDYVPRAAVLSDQQGDYVYVVNAQNHVEQRRMQSGPIDAVDRGDHVRPQ